MQLVESASDMAVVGFNVSAQPGDVPLFVAPSAFSFPWIFKYGPGSNVSNHSFSKVACVLDSSDNIIGYVVSRKYFLCGCSITWYTLFLTHLK